MPCSPHPMSYHLEALSLPATAAGYEKAIAELEIATAAMKQARNSAISPIFKLPVEVLTEMFHWFCHSDPTADQSFLHPNQAFPVLALAGVCYAWRAVAYPRPKLWSVMNIQLQDSWEATVIKWLAKSESSMLSVRIHSGSPPSPSIPQKMSNALLDCAHRWRELDLYIDNHEQLRSWLSLAALKLVPNFQSPHSTLPISQAANVCFPALEFLRLPRDTLHEMGPYVSSLFGMCPTLQSYSGELYLSSQLDLSQIKRFRTPYAGAKSLGHFLRRLPKLSHCTLLEFGLERDPVPTPVPTSVETYASSITELSLVNPYPQIYKTDNMFFRNASLPHLTSLELSGFETVHEGEFEALCNILLSSQCKLQKLTLHVGPALSFLQTYGITQCIKLLKINPHVISLTLVGYDVPESLTRLAQYLSSQPPDTVEHNSLFSPSIRNLDLTFRRRSVRWNTNIDKIADEIVDPLCRILQARKSSLRIVSLCFGDAKWDNGSFQTYLRDLLQEKVGDWWNFSEAAEGKGEGVMVLPLR
ncbi:hypothetical protein D9757_001214 [Collybiopsis confluens]|uniref:F-box domain-containing protein n=1 Tax=Collybiopsis confluens TaxID=2823264 RepID=A0A8H5MFU4_9AGAR|nr:hypothetical protein D9757_001214 [Collybiopsis confluens]